MKQTKAINEPVLDALTKKGQKLRKLFDQHQITALNIMASPGAGKTSLILQTIERLKKDYRIAVIEGDVVLIDVEKIQQTGVPVVLAHTGGSCHLDSIMIETALKKLDLDTIDLLIVENVGNLICPANFYLGTHKNIVIASVPEGDDKPYKYPNMFRGADIVLLNKIDYVDTQDFNMEYFSQGIKDVSPTTALLPVSAKNGAGIDQWLSWIKEL